MRLRGDDMNWEGRNSISRRRFLADAAALSAVFGVSHALGMQHGHEASGRTLKSLMGRCGGLVGTQASKEMLQGAGGLVDFIVSNCSIVTPGNHMKWSTVRPGPRSFQFGDADWVVDFCQKKGIAVHGHNLCWNEDNPAWLTASLNKYNGEHLLTEHISTVAGRYKGKIDSWDVVNEPVATWFNRDDGLRPGPWIDALGPEYIDLAFYLAADADPKALRVMNLNHVEQQESQVGRARQKTLDLLHGMLSRKVPIQAVGLECHLDTSKPTDAVPLAAFIQQIRQMGLEVIFTEMDVLDVSAPGGFAARDAAVAKVYAEFLAATLPAASPKRIIFWSLSDRGNWYDFMARTTPMYRRQDSLLHRPGLLDIGMNPKPSMVAVQNALRQNCH